MLLANRDKIIQLASKIVELYNVEDLEATIKAIQYLEKVEINGVIQEEEYNKLLKIIVGSWVNAKESYKSFYRLY